MVREENEHHQSTQNVNELNENPVSWVNQQGCGENESMTSGSDDYMVISIKRTKNVTEFKDPWSLRSSGGVREEDVLVDR